MKETMLCNVPKFSGKTPTPMAPIPHKIREIRKTLLETILFRK
jgi:hypothetical protein